MKRIGDWFLLLPLLIYVDGAKNALKCYQCAVDDNKLCTDEYLTTCPDNQAYDSCMTRVSKTKVDGFLIQKSCALAPCTLRDHKQSEGLGLDDCDRSKEEYDCTSCCKTDGCNTNGGSTYRPSAATSLEMLLLCTFFFWTRTLAF